MGADLYTSGRYAEANPTWHEEDAPHKAWALAETIRYCGLRPATVVDVGCGTGAVLYHLKTELDPELPETSYEGWDIAPAALRRARQREQHRLTFVCEDFLESERVADLILCVDTFEHVGDDVAFLRALRPRAPWFLFRIPLDLSLLDLARPRRLLTARRAYGHRHAYTRELAYQALREAGYTVAYARYHRIPQERFSPRGRVVDLARRGLFAVHPHTAVRLLGGWSLIVTASAR